MWQKRAMSLAQACIRFLGTAAVLIAVYLIPSAAWAHASHGQHGAQVSTAVAHHDHAAAKTANRAGTIVSSPGEATIVTAAVVPGRSSDPESGCVMGCCAMGAGCCPGVMAVAGFPQVGPVSQARLVRPRHLAVAGGIDPEALPKPPRSLV